MPTTMIKLSLALDLNYLVGEYGADFVFNIHAAHTACQTLASEQLMLSPPVEHRVDTDPATGNRYLRLKARAGALHVAYRATVELRHHFAAPETLAEVPVERMPLAVLGYLYPSRYCQSDRLIKLAIREFGALRQGHARVEAIQAWVRERVSFTSNSSNSNTAAVDTLIEQRGVCRDFAHLMIALCRAVNIPARFATGTDYGSDPALGPPDFHAYVEVYLGEQWVIFDPSATATPMGLVRFGTGRDAADVAFATIFGAVSSQPPLVSVLALEDAAAGIGPPYHCREAISTDGVATLC